MENNRTVIRDRSEFATSADADIETSVSVIVPAFNAADSIGRCLASVIGQALTGVEIIVIDDGSCDGTHAVVAEVAREHPHANIRMHRQSNQGVSVARNHGLALARGRYILFVDADDTLTEDALPALWLRAESDQLDVLLSNAWWHDLAGRPPRLMLSDPGELTAWMAGSSGSGRDWIIQRVAERRMKHYVWCQFVRRDWVLRTGVRFIPGTTHQDIVWTNAMLARASRVGFTPQPTYHYRQRAGSLSQPRDYHARLRTARHYLRVAHELDELVQRAVRQDAALARAFAWQAMEAGIAPLHALRQLDPERRERLCQSLAMQRHFSRLWRNALTLSHRVRVLKRSARYLVWSAGQLLAHWWRPGSQTSAHASFRRAGSGRPAQDSQIGAD
jgi:heptose III glucuronosyltransferase